MQGNEQNQMTKYNDNSNKVYAYGWRKIIIMLLTHVMSSRLYIQYLWCLICSAWCLFLHSTHNLFLNNNEVGACKRFVSSSILILHYKWKWCIKSKALYHWCLQSLHSEITNFHSEFVKVLWLVSDYNTVTSFLSEVGGLKSPETTNSGSCEHRATWTLQVHCLLR